MSEPQDNESVSEWISEYYLGRDCSCEQDKKCQVCSLGDAIKSQLDKRDRFYNEQKRNWYQEKNQVLVSEIERLTASLDVALKAGNLWKKEAMRMKQELNRLTDAPESMFGD